jgi:hypothetical protein
MQRAPLVTIPTPATVRNKSTVSKSPTHGIPLAAGERDFKPTKGWIGGPRFDFVSKFGSKSSNSGTHKRKKSKPAQLPERRVIIPGWARKYAAVVIN